MKCAGRLMMMAAVLLVGASATDADSRPIIDGQILGVELCPQSICGQAHFTGLYRGKFGSRPNILGTFDVAINHDPLPDAGHSADITGGSWDIQVGLTRIGGTVSEGSLFNNGDNTFTVAVILQFTFGGTGELEFLGTLNHNIFPPLIQGSLAR